MLAVREILLTHQNATVLETLDQCCGLTVDDRGRVSIVCKISRVSEDAVAFDDEINCWSTINRMNEAGEADSSFLFGTTGRKQKGMVTYQRLEAINEQCDSDAGHVRKRSSNDSGVLACVTNDKGA